MTQYVHIEGIQSPPNTPLDIPEGISGGRSRVSGLDIDWVGLTIQGKGHAKQDHEIDDPTKGFVLHSPNGTPFRIRVTDSGSLYTENLDV